MNPFSSLLRRFRRPKGTLTTSFRSYKQNFDRRKKPILKPIGTQSAPTFKTRSRKSLTWPWKFQLFIGLLGILALLYVVIFTKTFEIQKIEVVGDPDTLVEQQRIQKALGPLLGSSLLNFGAHGTEANFRENFPNLKDIRVKKTGLHTIRVSLESYDIVAKIKIVDEAGTERWVLANELGQLSEGITEEDLPIFTMKAQGTASDLKLLAIPATTLQNILLAKSSFEAKFNLKVTEMDYLSRAREVHLTTDREFVVWIDLTEDVETQLGKLKKALTKLDIYGSPLEYIDLRISGQDGEKVIYKLRQDI